MKSPGNNRQKILFSNLFFIFLIALLVITSFISYRRINMLNYEADRVTHTNLVKLKMEQLLSAIKDAETAQRGYLITKDSSFLEELEGMEENTRYIMNEVDSLTFDNPPQQRNLQLLKTATLHKYTWMKFVLSIARLPSPDISYYLLNGKKMMDSIVDRANDMIENEDLLLEKRIRRKDRSASIAPVYSLLFSLLTILIVTLVYFRLRRERTLRSKAEDSEATIHGFFMQVPAMLAILKGPDHLVEFANPHYRELIGEKDPIGKSLFENIPGIKGQGYDALLNEVYTSGKSYVGKEVPLTIEKEGQRQVIYVNLIYQPFADKSGKTEGILIFCYDVSEMVINRKKIEELELRSRLAIEAADMGTFDWDLQNQKFQSSDRLFEIFGFRGRTDVSHNELIAAFHPDDKPIRDKAVESSFEKGSLVYEARVIWPDKSIHWVNVFGKVIYNEQAKAMRMYGTAIDISRQKNILDELMKSESKFRLLADSMPQQVWTSDNAGHLTYFNRVVYDYSGKSFEALYQSGWKSFVHPAEMKAYEEAWNNAVQSGSEFIFEHRLLNNKGEFRWHMTRAIPQKGPGNDSQMWVGTITDIDDQKMITTSLETQIQERTEKLRDINLQLKSLEERYSTIINEVKDYVILLLDKDGNIRNWNKAAEKIKGYSGEDIIGKNFSIFYTDEDKALGLPEKLIEEASLKGKAEIQGWRLRKDGSRFWGSIIITSLHDEKNNLTGFTKVTRDLTDKKNAEDRLLEYLQSIEQKNQELQQTNAELEAFNYIASHDLQEPLRKIQTFSQRIIEKDRQNLSEVTKDYFNRMISAASRMQNLIDALISYSRTNAAKQDAQPTNMNTLLQEVKDDLQESIDDKKALITWDNMPVLQVIPLQIYQLFINIITNALKYRKPDVPPHIHISYALVNAGQITEPGLQEDIPYHSISIQDNGIGFEERYRTKIFELFQRLHGKTEYGGTGIGLAICKKIMRNHDGIITASGEPGVGAVFTIYLPAIG
ncbi:MAG TPA: PAS domain S-box protein [Ferruginibacter sp.]|mgnify:CR=1 FL=1|nr:PAS domain S-box protein [Ferruginibacter sp.]